MIIALAVALSFAPLEATAPAVRITPTTTIPDTARCPQWWPLAQEVGWPGDQLPHVDRVMWCESTCQPTAHNRRSGASGLMQIMPGWWDGRDPYDPAVNLAMALDIHEAYGVAGLVVRGMTITRPPDWYVATLLDNAADLLERNRERLADAMAANLADRCREAAAQLREQTANRP